MQAVVALSDIVDDGFAVRFGAPRLIDIGACRQDQCRDGAGIGGGHLGRDRGAGVMPDDHRAAMAERRDAVRGGGQAFDRGGLRRQRIGIAEAHRIHGDGAVMPAERQHLAVLVPGAVSDAAAAPAARRPAAARWTRPERMEMKDRSIAGCMTITVKMRAGGACATIASIPCERWGNKRRRLRRRALARAIV